ncbi:MAG: alkyl/aryl-sulfatase [Acidimicrobiales bacterium]
MSETTAPQPQAASSHTAARNAAVAVSFDDAGDTDRATRGLIAQHPTGRIPSLSGRVAWDTARHDFLRTNPTPPPTAHPGLWRQARLNANHGLFKVADGIWQARGYDISNITFIAGDDGWLIIDPLTHEETARACLELANETLGVRPVTTVIYTHSHTDHYGGVLGVTTPEEVAAGNVRIVAPDGFMHEVVGENAVAGPIMLRRAMFQFGAALPTGERGHIDCGLGIAVPQGRPGLIAPTDLVTETGQEMTLSGVRVVFQNTPNAEAPAEMNFYFPEKRALCTAENCTHTMHNLYPIRGALARDSLAWSKYIHEALGLWGGDADLLFASHHWPRFGNDDVRAFLEMQRDVYRWIHDQTMRLANHGYVPTEIAAALSLSDCFDQSHVQGYYGTVSHNSRSVYNRYLGWYDGNPAHLDPLPVEDAARRYVDMMGGADAVLSRARADFEAGDYRWVAQVVNHLVFADPTNTEARELQADTLEQLGYQCESATWRNAYLNGAQELRHGSPEFRNQASRNLVDAMEAENIFDVLGVRFDPSRFPHESLTINWTLTDLGEDHTMGVKHAAIHHTPGRHAPDAAATITLTRPVIFSLFEDAKGIDDAIAAGHLVVDGDVGAVRDLFGALDVFYAANIVEP